MPDAAPSPGLIPLASPRVPNLSERGPMAASTSLAPPKTVPPNKCLRPVLCAPLTERHGWQGVSPQLKETTMAYGKNTKKSTATRNQAPGTDRLARRRARGKEVLEPHRRCMGTRGRRGYGPATRSAAGHRRPHRFSAPRNMRRRGLRPLERRDGPLGLSPRPVFQWKAGPGARTRLLSVQHELF
jgi:hypothetical protein